MSPSKKIATQNHLLVAQTIPREKEQPPESRWLPFATRATFMHAAIVAVIIGSILTLINQSGWVAGSEPLQLLPLIMVFLTPFAVVTVSQVAGARQAYIDSDGHRMPANLESFMGTIVEHGIPARAVAIGLAVGSLNTIIVLANALLRSGDLAALSIVPLGQAYVLPLLFGLLSQAISYRRSRYQGVKV